MSKGRELRGLFVPHCCDSHNWKLRANKHPIDPAWEDGRYKVCHRDIRRKVANNFQDCRYVIFDTVMKGPHSRKTAVIRSAFEITDVKKRLGQLGYKSFWFCHGKNPIKSPSPRMARTKDGMKLCSRQTARLLKRIESSGQYAMYKAPRKNPPLGVRREDWNEMVEASKKERRSCR